MEKEKTAYNGVDELVDDLEIYFGEFLSGKAPVAFVTHQNWRPRIDLYETTDTYHLMVELGGVKIENIQADFEDGRLTIHGRRGNLVPKDEVDCHRMEINAGPFERCVTFRTPVDPGTIKTRYGEGILKVELRKVPEQIQGVFSIRIKSI